MLRKFLKKPSFSSLVILFVAITITSAIAAEYKSGVIWPKPEVIQPAEIDKAPSDAIVLFDGKDLSAWKKGENWEISDEGYATVKKSGITTKESFGDIQLHVEFATPEKVKGDGQGRGNSGVYLMGKYEVQILDSYDNETYYDGQCGSIYKQSPPMVNACRKPGEWQTYDILFTAPKFNQDGSLKSPAYMTVFQNGVCIHNHFELTGDTAWHRPPEYKKHPEKLPISLQNHGNPIRFRNIWVRELHPLVGKLPEVKKEETEDKKPEEKKSEEKKDKK